tara:strand:- start:3615 stop:4064 length:450 start_codon:yes stop_codon:yes gene_type:complete
MGLVEQINADIKTAMKAKDRDKLNTVRAIKSEVLKEATKDGAGDEIEDAVVVKILQKLLKQRKDSAALYIEQGREDLAAEEVVQADILATYLPEMMSEEDIAVAVIALIEQLGANGPKDMGKVMGAASKALAGKADNKLVAQVVKSKLV